MTGGLTVYYFFQDIGDYQCRDSGRARSIFPKARELSQKDDRSRVFRLENLFATGLICWREREAERRSLLDSLQ
jgi:hypothetical protein